MGPGAPSLGHRPTAGAVAAKLEPEMPPCYDSVADPSAFLLAYEEAVFKAGGDDKVMANWLPMALTGAPRT